MVDVPIPRNFEELGIPIPLIHDLVLRQSTVDGRTSTVKLAEKLKMSPVLITTIVEELRELKYMEVQGLDGRDYLLAPTEAGKRQAQDRMQLCRYTGPAPVTLEQYTRVIKAQKASPKVNLSQLRDAFSDLVISDRLLLEVGPAAIAGGAMFLYGPPGTGKSSIAERLLRVYDDHVLVPYTVEVDGQIISVFDPVVHEPIPEQPEGIDPRWVLCKRPFIIVGGELNASMLDLAYQQGSGIYLAPLQMQANNGVLVIDDFGRQKDLTPAELLNRWIVPLDRQVDYLMLDYGVKFEVPFDPKIVFSTNLQPATLGDEAFFRRIQSKILIPTITDDQFETVLQRVAEANGVELTPDAPTHLRWMSRELGDGDLRPYLPGAVIKILKAICAFEERPMILDPMMIERIANMYFTHADDESEEEQWRPPPAPEPPFTPSAEAERLPAPKAPSIFANAAATGSSPVPNGAGNTRDWTEVAASAINSLSDEPGDDEIDPMLEEAALVDETVGVPADAGQSTF